MKRRKQGNSATLDKHRQEYRRNLDTIARLKERNKELEPIITEEENMAIVALVRSANMGLDELQRFVTGLREGGVPFLTAQNDDKQSDEEEKTDEAE